MTTRQKKRDDRQVKAFFDQWHVYRIIIENDYMSHCAIHSAIHQILQKSKSQPLRILDLGCGDASGISKALSDLAVEEYLGIDLSPVALQEAQRNLESNGFKLNLVESELSDFLKKPQAQKVDFIVAGFVVHHFTDDEKSEFFNSCIKILNPGGEILLYDVMCRPGESRQEYLNSYCDNLITNWSALTDEEKTVTCEHIKNNDYPVSYSNLKEFACTAGFTSLPDPVYRDSNSFHTLCRFRL